MRDKRYQSLDLLKTIAITFVVIYHCQGLTYKSIEIHGVTEVVNYMLMCLISTCVPLFFIVNGALLLNRNLNIKKHSNKTIKIIIITLIWSALTNAILIPIKGEYISINEFIRAIILFKLGWNNHLWFMKSLIIIYFIFPFLKYLFDKRAIFLYIVTAIIFLITFGRVTGVQISNILNGQTIAYRTYTNLFPIVYFVIGGLLFQEKEKLNKKNIKYCSIIVLIVSIISLFLYGTYMSNNSGSYFDIVWNGYNTIFTFLITCALFIVTLNYTKKISIVDKIGNNTLGIYFIHMIVIQIVQRVLINLNFVGNEVFNLLISIPIFMVTYVFILLIKEIPVVNKLVLI